MESELLEKLAALEHEQWAHWMKYFFEKCFTIQMKLGVAVKIEQKDFDRWSRQMKTPYNLLSEKEKNSDREWAKKTLSLIESSKRN